MKKGEILTFFCGPSSPFLKVSSSGLPIRNSPPGTAIILMQALVPGTVSSNEVKDVTSAAFSYLTPVPVVTTLPFRLLCS